MSVTEQELEFLFPEKEINIAGREFTLRPFSLHEAFVVAEKLQSALSLLKEGMTTEEITSLLIQTRDGVEDVMALSLGLDVEVIRKFDLKSAFKAVRCIVEVNKDFFIQEVMKEFEDLKLTAKIPGKGNTRSAKRS